MGQFSVKILAPEGQFSVAFNSVHGPYKQLLLLLVSALPLIVILTVVAAAPLGPIH